MSTPSKQTPQEYYASYETCRNRWFDLYDEEIEDIDITEERP